MRIVRNLGWSLLIIGVVLFMAAGVLWAVLVLSHQWQYNAEPAHWIGGAGIAIAFIGFLLVGIADTIEHICRP